MKIGLKLNGVRRKVVVGTVGVMAAGGAFLAISPATANGSTHASAIRFKYVTGQHSWQGHVTSDTPDCMAGRSVVIFRQVPGPDTVAASGHTNGKGFFRISYPLTSGIYYATVKKVALPGYSNTVCSKASSTIRVIS